MPLGVAGGVPYVAVVVMSLFAPGTRAPLAFAAVGSALTLLGYALSPAESEPCGTTCPST